MPVPKSVIRFDKNGVKYISSVDYAEYSIEELTRAALRDVGKLISRYANKTAAKLRGLSKTPRVRGKNSPFQYWVRKKELDLKVGGGDTDGGGHFGASTGYWYGIKQELGLDGMPKLAILTNTVRSNIPEIIRIESQYLTALNGEYESLIESEDDYRGGGDE